MKLKITEKTELQNIMLLKELRFIFSRFLIIVVEENCST